MELLAKLIFTPPSSIIDILQISIFTVNVLAGLIVVAFTVEPIVALFSNPAQVLMTR